MTSRGGDYHVFNILSIVGIVQQRIADQNILVHVLRNKVFWNLDLFRNHQAKVNNKKVVLPFHIKVVDQKKDEIDRNDFEDDSKQQVNYVGGDKVDF